MNVTAQVCLAVLIGSKTQLFISSEQIKSRNQKASSGQSTGLPSAADMRQLCSALAAIAAWGCWRSPCVTQLQVKLSLEASRKLSWQQTGINKMQDSTLVSVKEVEWAVKWQRLLSIVLPFLYCVGVQISLRGSVMLFLYPMSTLCCPTATRAQQQRSTECEIKHHHLCQVVVSRILSLDSI